MAVNPSLGNFSVLPHEIRDEIWNYVLIHFRPARAVRTSERLCPLAALSVSRQFYIELAHIYYGTRSLVLKVRPWCRSSCVLVKLRDGEGEELRLPSLHDKGARIVHDNAQDKRAYLQNRAWTLLRQLPFRLLRSIDIEIYPMEADPGTAARTLCVELIIAHGQAERISTFLFEVAITHGKRLPRIQFVQAGDIWGSARQSGRIICPHTDCVQCTEQVDLGSVMLEIIGGRMGMVLVCFERLLSVAPIHFVAHKETTSCFTNFLEPALGSRLHIEKSAIIKDCVTILVVPAFKQCLRSGRWRGYSAQSRAFLSHALDYIPGKRASLLHYKRFEHWHTQFDAQAAERDIALCPSERQAELTRALCYRMAQAETWTEFSDGAEHCVQGRWDRYVELANVRLLRSYGCL